MITLFFSCNQKSETKDKDSFSMNEISRTVGELEEDIIENGSVDAYEDFSIAYIDYRQFGDFYKMSKIMADKYDFVPAYYRVFSCLAERKNGYTSNDKYNLDGLSIKEKKEALKYLRLGAEKGEEQCKNRIKSYIEEKRYFVASDTLIFNRKKK